MASGRLAQRSVSDRSSSQEAVKPIAYSVFTRRDVILFPSIPAKSLEYEGCSQSGSVFGAVASVEITLQCAKTLYASVIPSPVAWNPLRRLSHLTPRPGYVTVQRYIGPRAILALASLVLLVAISPGSYARKSPDRCSERGPAHLSNPSNVESRLRCLLCLLSRKRWTIRCQG